MPAGHAHFERILSCFYGGKEKKQGRQGGTVHMPHVLARAQCGSVAMGVLFLGHGREH
jgi:hypothetical protein